MGRAVDSLLSGSSRVDSGHQPLDDTEIVVDDLGERSQAIGRAGRIRDDSVLGVVCLQVDATNEHWGISGRGGDDDLLGATLQMSGGPAKRWLRNNRVEKGGSYFSVVVKTPVDSTM